MIIITSNEDLIRKLSVGNTKNTRIIELDDETAVASVEKTNDNNNIINLALLAELSEPNSGNDQVYKRALSSSDRTQQKPAKTQKKSSDLICTICGARAIGFNYDALSCGSCKAFFHRNAHQNFENMKCLTGQNRCSVAYDVHRKCQRCRLARCFAAGMRKDFILSEEEKERRKRRLEENRNMLSVCSKPPTFTSPLSVIDVTPKSESSPPSSEMGPDIDRLLKDITYDQDNSILDDIENSNNIEDVSLEMVVSENLAKIENMRLSFLSFFKNQNFACSCIDELDHANALVTWSEGASRTALRFIEFFRQIDEFESLLADDRFILIKYNLLPVFPIFKVFMISSFNDLNYKEEIAKWDTHRRFFMLCGEASDIQENFRYLVDSLIPLTATDPAVLSLLSAILIFSPGLSMNECEPPLTDPIAVYRAQSYYTSLLWNYAVSKWDEAHAQKFFIQLLSIVCRIQVSSKRFREFFRSQFITTNTVDRMAPLMQTFLHIN